MFVKFEDSFIGGVHNNVASSIAKYATALRCVARVACTCAMFCFCAAISKPSIGQDATLTGTWTYKLDAKEETKREAAIDEATQRLNFLARGRAREMLLTKTKPAAELRISDEGDRVTISQGDQRVSVKTDKSPTQVTIEQGVVTVRAFRKQGKLTVTSGSDGGVRTVSYQISEKGNQLILETSIAAKQIQEPIRYRTTYHRKETR